MLWSLALVVGTALFHVLGDGPLAPPPLDPGTWNAWAQGRDPLVATIAVLRLVALALSWYLVGATTVGILARMLRAARLVRIADALTVPALRRLLQGALGVSLATAMVTAAVPPSAFTVPETATVTLRASDTGPGSPDADPAPGSAADPATGSAADPATGSAADPAPGSAADPAPGSAADPDADLATDPGAVPVTDPDAMVRLAMSGEVTAGIDPGHAEGVRPLPIELSDRSTSADASGSATDAAPAPRTPDAGEHVVATGESFWTIARDAVVEVVGSEPDDARIHAHWRRLIDANRDRLADPDNPDLIFPGQRLVLPRPDGAGS